MKILKLCGIVLMGCCLMPLYVLTFACAVPYVTVSNLTKRYIAYAIKETGP